MTQKKMFQIDECSFQKNMENVRNHRDIKLIINKARRNYLISEQNYQTTKYFSENLLAIEIK